jgi:hypothetical protein
MYSHTFPRTASPWHFHDQEGLPRYGQVSAGQDGRWILSFTRKGDEPMTPREMANAKRMVQCVDTHDYLVMALEAAVAGYKEPDRWVGPACSAIEKATQAHVTEMAPTPTPWSYYEQGDANDYCLLTPDKDGWVLGFLQNGELSLERQRENCHLMVKSVNAHEDLVTTLRLAVNHKYVLGLWLDKARNLLASVDDYALQHPRQAPAGARERG